MADGDILISIRGDASQLESEVFRAQGALDDLEGSADDTGGSLASMGKSAGQLNTAMKGLSRGGINAVASGIGLINPQAAQLIRTLGAMRMLTGPLAVALGVLAAAFAAYKHEVDRAAQAAEDAQKRIENFNEAFDAQAVIAEDLRNELRMVRGEIDKEGLALEKRKTRIQAAGDAVVAAIDEEIAAQRELLDVEARQRGGALRNQAEVRAIEAKIDSLQSEREAAEDATQSQLDAADAVAEYNRELRESERFIREREEAQTQAAARAAEAAVMEAEARAEADRMALKATQDLIALEESLALRRQLRRNKEQQDQDEQAREQQEKRDKASSDEEKAAAFSIATQESIAVSMRGVSDLSSVLASQMVEDNKKAARALHITAKASGLAQVGINTAVAITKALADLGPLAGTVAAVGIGLTGAAQAAAIAAQPAPVAHIGTGLAGSRDPLAPDERMRFGTRTLATEMSGPAGTINSTGSTLINDANNGRLQTSGGPMVAVIGRSHLDRELFRSGRRGTSRYARQLRTNPHPDPQRGF
jgi:hypothetical protein